MIYEPWTMHIFDLRFSRLGVRPGNAGWREV